MSDPRHAGSNLVGVCIPTWSNVSVRSSRGEWRHITDPDPLALEGNLDAHGAWHQCAWHVLLYGEFRSPARAVAWH